jgi:hypothetical protein
MNPEPRKLDKESQDLIDEYLKNGGEVKQYQKYLRSEEIGFKGGFYARRKKAKEEKES